MDFEKMLKELKEEIVTIDEDGEGYIERKIFEQLTPKASQQEFENFLIEHKILVVDEKMLAVEDIDEDDSTFIDTKCLDRDKQYTKELLAHHRLSDQEEYELLMIVQAGRKAKELVNSDDFKSFNPNIIAELNRKIEKGEEARKTILLSYSRFIISIAREYVVAKGYGTRITMTDLYQSGYEGLMIAFDKFDISKNNKLATFSRFYIMNAIQELIASLRNHVAVSKSTQYERSRLMKFINNYHAEHRGQDPSYREMAIFLGAKTEAQIEKKCKVIIPNLLNSSRPVVNLDAYIDSDEDTTFANYVPDTNSDPLESMVKEEANQLLYKMLGEFLNDTERYIVFCRYGLNGFVKKSLEELGAEFNLTRERIRQIENNAVAKLASSVENVQVLKGLMR